MGDKNSNLVKKGNSAMRATLRGIERPIDLGGNHVSPVRQRNQVQMTQSPSNVVLPAAPEDVDRGRLMKTW